MKKAPEKKKPTLIKKDILLEKKSSSPFVLIALCLLILIFCLSLFKNISYPLIWNDEADGAMYAERILEYGYPKVHDGKNTVFMSFALLKDENGKLLGYKEKGDVFIYATWGNYYWATIGAYLARFTNDIYLKTALLRGVFALAGLLGLLLFVMSARKLFDSSDRFKLFVILFIFVELFSISLVLHMREARYYSLVILCSGAFFYIYSRHYLYKIMGNVRYYIWMTLLLFLTFQVNVIAFGVFVLVIALNRMIAFLFRIYEESKKFLSEFILALKETIPIVAAGVLVYPFIVYFEIFKTSDYMTKYFKYTTDVYWTNLGTIFKYLSELELLYTFILVKIIWLLLRLFFYRSISGNRKKYNKIQMIERFSLFATSFFIIYGLMIAKIPSYAYVRYYIVLQPVMVLIMVTDVFIIFNQINFLEKKIFSTAKYLCGILIGISFFLNAKNKIKFMEGHLYEMTHQYKGVLDYVIPYIQENYKNPEELVIATNYEEFCYMYYLGSKVTIGYINNNIEDDLKHIPDIIMYRKGWGTNPKYFNELMQKAQSQNIQYKKISFPVADFVVNNIPELDFKLKHQFITLMANSEAEMAEIYVKTK